MNILDNNQELINKHEKIFKCLLECNNKLHTINAIEESKELSLLIDKQIHKLRLLTLGRSL